LARRVFTLEERESLLRGERDFLELWTRKEAVLKALGVGFAGNASEIDAGETTRRHGWLLHPFTDPECVGSVCLPADFHLRVVAWKG